MKEKHQLLVHEKYSHQFCFRICFFFYDPEKNCDEILSLRNVISNVLQSVGNKLICPMKNVSPLYFKSFTFSSSIKFSLHVELYKCMQNQIVPERRELSLISVSMIYWLFWIAQFFWKNQTIKEHNDSWHHANGISIWHVASKHLTKVESNDCSRNVEHLIRIELRSIVWSRQAGKI